MQRLDIKPKSVLYALTLKSNPMEIYKKPMILKV